MLIAEIRHKLLDLDEVLEVGSDVPAQLRSLLSACKEDLLTADVFGAIKYLPRKPYLTDVFRAIAQRNGSARRFLEHVDNLDAVAEECAFAFWPSYRNPLGMPGDHTEPDVELSVPNTLVFFEAKLHSGFGAFQIERQLLIGLERARGREFFLVLVTAKAQPPRLRLGDKRLSAPDYLREVARSNALPKQYRGALYENADRALWVNWQALFSTLEAAHRHRCDQAGVASDELRCSGDILADLRSLLEMRQLQPFSGIGGMARIAMTDRPVFLPIRLRPRFPGISVGTLPSLVAVTSMSARLFPESPTWSPNAKRPFVSSIVARYQPLALPARWLASPDARAGGQFIARAVAQYTQLFPKVKNLPFMATGRAPRFRHIVAESGFRCGPLRLLRKESVL